MVKMEGCGLAWLLRNLEIFAVAKEIEPTETSNQFAIRQAQLGNFPSRK